MKRLILPAVVVLFLAVVFGFLGDSLLSSGGDAVLNGDQDSDMESVYLRLFREYKKSNANPHRRSAPNRQSDYALSRDPFVRPGADKSPKSKSPAVSRSTKSRARSNPLQLGGILWDEHAPGAVINNKIVQVNSYVGRYRVESILPEKVILSSKTGRVVLSMPKPKTQ